MGKKVKYKFDYMYEDAVMSTVTVYTDGSVDEHVNLLFSTMVFDENRPDKDEILENLEIPFYDPYLIVRVTKGLMASSCQWIRFEGDTITWQELRARALLPTY